MCGRYVATTGADGLVQMLVVDERDPRADPSQVRWNGEPNYNVAPTDHVPAVVLHDGKRVLTSFRWGLVPFWAKDPKIGARMINARSETVPTKSAFAESFEQRRCLLPADGFYEWHTRGGHKFPWLAVRTDGDPMVFAGIWASWRDKSDPDADRLLTCSILTTAANDAVAPIHDRMPVILDRSDWDTWLDPQTTLEDLQDLLRPAPATAIKQHRVSQRVNSVSNNDAALLDPVPDQTPAAQEPLFN
ncbi:SOS response-associated peptidase [soil metagenome]